MGQPAADVVVSARGSRWVRLRVRGLLRNAELAARIRAHRPAGAPAYTISLATGTVRVELDGAAAEAVWVGLLLRCVAADATPARGAAGQMPAGRAAAAPAARGAPARGATRAGAAPQPRAPGAATNSPGTRTPAVDAAHALPLAELLRRLGEGQAYDVRRGLGAAEAAARLARDGRNEIRDLSGRSASQILLDQFKSVPVALLGASAGLALSTRAFADAAAIGAVLAANSGLGFVTERRAEETVSSLRKLAPRQASVVRDGRTLQIDAREVVVGDLLVLRPGEPVAADARVIEAHRLATNEAALTGESLPVKKHAHAHLPAETPLGERSNMVFLGTVVSGGAGLAVVVATAERAALGRIRELAQGAEAPRTRLQVELDRLGRRLAIGAALLCVGVFAIGALRARPLLPLLRTAVSLGVAAIPEGLPTVATSLLAAGIRSLRDRQVYARRLDAVENLGAVDTVCFDKTGTLTHNRMSVASLTLGLDLVALDEAAAPPPLPEPWLRVAALCHSVEPAEGGAAGAGAPRWQGSSTELAIVEFAQARGADVAALRRSHPLLGVRQRSEHHPYMVTLHDSADHGLLVAVKGRPDEVLARCEAWHDGQAVQPLGADTRLALLALNDRLAARGERVLALAFRQHPNRAYGETGGLCWLGLVGLADPLRADLPPMMARFRAAGIRPLMITGDQLGTARAVARRIGLADGEHIVDAGQLPEQAQALADIAEQASGFARTSPAMKLELVRALQQRGHVVAMTGDGINDGPALKTADVGVAMGVTGTDFAHAMSDLVLREDHPAAMLAAIEQGRTAFLNIQKSVRYLVTTNLSELAATTVAVAAGLPEPFDPLALLWTNIVTDIWPAVALGLEPPEPGVLERPPVALKDGLLGRQDWATVATDTGVMTLACLASFGYGLARHGASPQARTLAFVTLTSSQLLYALAARSSRPLIGGGLQRNRKLEHAVGWSLLAQAGTVALPFMRRLLRTAPIGPLDAAVALGAAAAPLLVRETLKHAALRRAGGPR
jgi:Ca2+-transporting ATPase